MKQCRGDDRANALHAHQRHRAIDTVDGQTARPIKRAVRDAQQVAGQRRILGDDARHLHHRRFVVIDGREQLRQQGVNGVRPGTIYTEMHASGGEPGRVDRLKSVIPLRRGGTVEEVAGAVLWPFSDEAGYTSGSFIEVSGGS